MKRVLASLEEHGLLLKQDKNLPSVTTIVAGRVLSGSWWGAPEAKAIFAVLEGLAHHEDVTSVKLVAGKDTFVHRRLWPDLLGVAQGPHDWQMSALEDAASRLLDRVEAEGEVLATGPAAKSLAMRLLAASTQVHTAEGKHATALLPWSTWKRRVKFVGRRRSSSTARANFESLVEGMTTGRRPKLPWD